MMKTDTPKTEKRVSRRTLLVSLLIGIFVLALGVTALTFVFVPQSVEPRDLDQTKFALLSDAGAANTLIYYEDLPLCAADGFVKKRSTAFGGDVEALLTDTGELLLLYQNGVEQICSGATDFKLAANGTALVFVQEFSLWHYKIGESAPRLVREIYDANLDRLAISPAGKRLVYTAPPPPDGAPSFQSWTAEDGESPLRENLVINSTFKPLAVSDDGQHLYYLTSEDTALYYACEEQTARKLTASYSAKFGSARLTLNLEEILFCEGNGYTYFSRLGEEKEKLSSGVATPVLERGEAVFEESVACIHSSQSFLDRLHLVGRDEARTLRFLSADFSSEKYASDVEEAVLSADGKTVCFSRLFDGRYRLYRIDLSRGQASETLLASGVTDYAFSPDGETVYYVTRGNKLYKQTESASTLLFEGATEVAVSPRGELFWTVRAKGHSAALYRLVGNIPVYLSREVTDFFFTESTAYVCLEANGLSRWYFVDGGELKALVHP